MEAASEARRSAARDSDSTALNIGQRFQQGRSSYMKDATGNNNKIRGRLNLTVRSADGEVTATRHASNMVLRKGAGVIARLFAGVDGAKPIDQIRVGFALEAGTAELTSLTPPKDSIPAAALGSPLSNGSFKIATDKPDNIQVSVTAVFKPVVDLENVTEAGLLAGDDLYNQVVFEPVAMRAGENVTFFWEIDFPFGR
ncbi:MAG: hypothetical protein DMF61_05815 [Blastocatellia bacterium AA13]|nr:MAG: hypothetical protein DMF61_05815 [Blastocatellia bacterium AA13]